jgi:hypothetical protein
MGGEGGCLPGQGNDGIPLLEIRERSIHHQRPLHVGSAQLHRLTLPHAARAGSSCAHSVSPSERNASSDRGGAREEREVMKGEGGSATGLVRHMGDAYMQRAQHERRNDVGSHRRLGAGCCHKDLNPCHAF